MYYIKLVRYTILMLANSDRWVISLPLRNAVHWAGNWRDAPRSNLAWTVFTAGAGTRPRSSKMQQACSKTVQEQDTKVIHTSVDVEYIDNDAVEFSLSVCSGLLGCFLSYFLEREWESIHSFAPLSVPVDQWKWDGVLTINSSSLLTMKIIEVNILQSQHKVQSTAFLSSLDILSPFPPFILLLIRCLYWFQTATVCMRVSL